MKTFTLILSTVLATALTVVSCTQNNETDNIDLLGVRVIPEENREYSFTDKKSGFWYGTTHQTETSWWSGWNISKRRIFSDYYLTIGNKKMDRTIAACTVYPNRIKRVWNEASESLYLIDNKPVIYVEIKAIDSLSIILNADLIDGTEECTEGIFFAPAEAPGDFFLLAPATATDFRPIGDGYGIKAPESAEGFVLTYGSKEEALTLLTEFRTDGKQWLQDRKDRMNALVTEYNPIVSNLPDLDKAIKWITLTMDELITEQQGKGIYAGLPWFGEYWGRDMFISIPGACYVSGQFDVAKQILLDFAKLQDTDPESPTWGRIPNLARPGNVAYNTADGTPRFVIETLNLVRYSGDTTFLREIYPAIKLSIDAALKNYTDAKGYMVHADADTWMDVKRNGIPGSPRGNRANDIQALWHGQLTSGATIAEMVGDTVSAELWNEKASALSANFENDYCDKTGYLIYDHLNTDDTPDLQFRPNQIYCFSLIEDDEFKQHVTRRVWEELVYPWGVSSLSQKDPQFHPQHENWHYYHKDDAYHNGTIWLWNNGMAMQRMIEYGEAENAWKLFCNMNEQALNQGAVGSLSENADAHPLEGQDWVKRSGTFLQAWSNAEHLRVWYQYFLGIRPDLLKGTIVVEPKLPNAITHLSTSVKIGEGTLYFEYNHGKYNVRAEGIDAEVLLIEPDRSKFNSAEIFQDVEFCTPAPLDHYPCFDTYYEVPLTY